MRIVLRPACVVAALLAVCALAALTVPAAAADAPPYRDAERADPVMRPARRAPEAVIEADRVCCGARRPVNDGPGYVGSVRGLGRPSYDGLWPAPGYGSYREHPLE